MRRYGLGLSLVVALLVAGAVLAFASSAQAPTRTACGTRASAATATLKVVGNHMEDSAGHPFVPYGISLVGGPETVRWSWTQKSSEAQIVASHKFWHANAVRIQVGEALLLDKPTPGHDYNVPFADFVNRLVCQVLDQGQVPILNDTTLFSTRSRGPTERSVKFWKFMSHRYGNRLPVIFDVFDEPRLGRNPRTNHFYSRARTWQLWERGGAIAGKRYIGMQALVDAIRANHVNNVLWVEEPWFLDAEMLPTAELPQHLLEGDNVVYAFHKVTLDDKSRSFRALASATTAGVPLVDSEWSQFAADNRPWECQDNAYAGVPRFLSFLRQTPIGVIAWSLQPGALVKGVPGVDTVHDGNDFRFTENPYDLAAPNELKPDYACTPAARAQGAGALIQDFFAKNTVEAPAALFPRLY